MNKTSTLVYSMHNLASKAEQSYHNVDDLDGKIEFAEVHKLLEDANEFDVRQEVIDDLFKKIAR